MYLLLIASLIAILDWVAVAQSWRKVETIAKPAVIITLLAWLWSAGGLEGRLAWFALGLVFSLAGDVFLMLSDARFTAGLVAFLLAHLAYLAGFNPTWPPLNLASLALAALVALVCGLIYRRISAGLQATGQAGLRGPVLAYVLAIGLMLLSALLTLVRPEWAALPAWLASGGALLFTFSDSLLAWDKFVAPIRHARVAVMMTYHLGQALIVVGATLHYA
jgi:uncharacterized membrane protein YhhN